MKNLLILFIIAFYALNASAQEKSYLKIRSLQGKVLNTIDSLMFTDDMSNSSFYIIDSLTKEAFTGKAVIYYGVNALDSIDLEKGYQEGWMKTYWIKNEGNLELSDLHYVSQRKLISVSKIIGSKLRTTSAFAKYYSKNGWNFLEVIYKHSGKIIVKQSFYSSVTGKSKAKFKYSTNEELEEYFRVHYQIYSYCKESGFFGVNEIQ